jgi:hypothetical protein
MPMDYLFKAKKFMRIIIHGLKPLVILDEALQASKIGVNIHILYFLA